MPSEQPERSDARWPDDDQTSPETSGEYVRRIPAEDHLDGGPIPSDPDALMAEVKVLREEVELLRRRLETAPARIRSLEERLLETKGRCRARLTQNAKLSETLAQAREQLTAMRDEIEKLSTPPQSYASFLNVDGGRHARRDGAGPQAACHGIARTSTSTNCVRGRRCCSTRRWHVVAVGAYEDRGEMLTRG